MERPAHAEYARTLIAQHDQGALSTIDRRSGTPYGSLVEYAPLENGDILLFISDLADHTKNLDEDHRASLLVAEGIGESQALAQQRVTLVGSAEPIDPDEQDERLTRHVEGNAEDRPPLAEHYLAYHPAAETYIDFEDFRFFRLTVERVRYIGGFGRMSWVEAEAYRRAEPDPIAGAAAGIVEHMNEDHADAMVEMARALGEIPWAAEVTMSGVDRYGCDLDVRGEREGEKAQETLRLNFDEALDDPAEARGAMIDLVERARRQLE